MYRQIYVSEGPLANFTFHFITIHASCCGIKVVLYYDRTKILKLGITLFNTFAACTYLVGRRIKLPSRYKATFFTVLIEYSIYRHLAHLRRPLIALLSSFPKYTTVRWWKKCILFLLYQRRRLWGLRHPLRLQLFGRYHRVVVLVRFVDGGMKVALLFYS